MNSGSIPKFKLISRIALRFLLGATALSVSLSACNIPLKPVTGPTATALSARQTLYAGFYPSPSPEDGLPPAPGETEAPPVVLLTPVPPVLPTPTLPPGTDVPPPVVLPSPTPEIVPPAGYIVYYSQSGDTLAAIASHYRVGIGQLRLLQSFAETEFLPVGTPVTIPQPAWTARYNQLAMPDSEVLFSGPAAVSDTVGMAAQAGGFINYYSASLLGGTFTGAQIVDLVARETSINPILLLALLEFRSGWVYGHPAGAETDIYPIGFDAPSAQGLYEELQVTARFLAQGYYGWRDGSLKQIVFKDKSVAQLAPHINAGTAALQNLFAAFYPQPEFEQALYGPSGFLALHGQMFGDPWARAITLLDEKASAPDLVLPFLPGEDWALTSGPHANWQTGSPRGAIDFAAITGQTGCAVSRGWVTASAPGLVTRSLRGVVAVDLDGDGNEGTGWVIVYLHLHHTDRVPAGTWVNTNDRLGHPSCEGGRATGAHLHLTFKYNGEWMPAEGRLPMVLSGWRVVAGESPYRGWLEREGQVVTANVGAPRTSWIRRD